MPLWYFFHSFGFWWVPNFGVYHVYSCLTCFDHWFVFYTLFPTCAFLKLCSCIAHNHLLHTPLLPLPCLALVYILFPHPWHVMFILYIVFLRCFVFCLSFIFSFILYPLCIFILVHIFFSFPRSFWSLCLFVSKRERVH